MVFGHNSLVLIFLYWNVENFECHYNIFVIRVELFYYTYNMTLGNIFFEKYISHNIIFVTYIKFNIPKISLKII